MFSRSMRRRLAFASLTTAAVLAAAMTPALGRVAHAAGPAPAYVTMLDCSVSEHAAVFRGRMTRVPDGARMGMRFTLLESTGAAGFEPVAVPGLGRWRRSRAGVGTFGYRQGVRNLAANATYRMRVDFRWWSASGATVERARRRSPSCRQFAAMPNLRARLEAADGTPVAGVVRYTIRVSNTGKAPVPAAPVRLTVDGDVVDTQSVSLPAGTHKLLTFEGPPCGASVEARADPDGEIAETSEMDNSHVVACAELPRR